MTPEEEREYEYEVWKREGNFMVAVRAYPKIRRPWTEADEERLSYVRRKLAELKAK